MTAFNQDIDDRAADVADTDSLDDDYSMLLGLQGALR